MTAALLSQLWVLDQYGPVEPSTLQGPVRQGLGKFGDGLFIEEGTTNLVTNPGAEVDLTGWSVVAGSATLSRDTTRMRYGVASVKVTVTGTGDVQVRAAASAYSSGNIAGGIDVYPARTATIDVTVGTIATRSSNIPAGQWTRCTTKTTVGSAGNLVDTTYNGGLVGDVFWLDAAQVEQKAYPTSFASGDLATPYNAPGAVYSDGFEDGTTSGWGGTDGTSNLSNVGVGFASGTRALAITSTGGAQYYAATGLKPATAGKTYSGTFKAKAATTGRAATASLLFLAADGVTLTGSIVTGASRTTVTTDARKLVVTATAPANTVYVKLGPTFTGGANGEIQYLDEVRIEEGTGCAAYGWTGADNASTSTRTAVRCIYTQALQSTQGTFSCVVRMGNTPPFIGEVFAVLNPASGGSAALGIGSPATSVQISNGIDASAAVSVSPAIGDLLFIAGTWSGTTLTVYVSKNGGALVSGTVTGGTAISSLSGVEVGNIAGGSYANSTVEQVLVYNRALTAAEITALAFRTDETAFGDDSAMVLAAGTGVVRGTVKASTAAGTGYYRGNRSVSALLESITATGANPDDDTATYKATVPAGSGIGQGQIVAFDQSGQNQRYTVQRVFAPGGVYDELLLAAA